MIISHFSVMSHNHLRCEEKQNVTSISALGHEEIFVGNKNEHIKCSVCKEVVVAQVSIPYYVVICNDAPSDHQLK